MCGTFRWLITVCEWAGFESTERGNGGRGQTSGAAIALRFWRMWRAYFPCIFSDVTNEESLSSSQPELDLPIPALSGSFAERKNV